MPRLSNFKAMVLSADVGGGKAVIEMKAAKSTWTVELPEDSGWVKVLVEGAIVNFPDIEVELPRGVDVELTGPRPGDQIKTSQGVETIPPKLIVVTEPPAGFDPTPDPEMIRQLHPIEGFNTVGINANIGGESVRAMLGIPDRPVQTGKIIATATRSSNDATT